MTKTSPPDSASRVGDLVSIATGSKTAFCLLQRREGLSGTRKKKIKGPSSLRLWQPRQPDLNQAKVL